jgi:hypothetical protein
MKVVNGEIVFDIGSEGIKLFSGKAIKSSIREVYEDQIKNAPDKKLAALFNMTRFATLEVTSAWLMENTIPKIKMAMWAREYTLKLDKNKEKLAAGQITKGELARDTMFFIEDRFGEVNWKNKWMKPSVKTSLQFLFRSFTWFTGSWVALSKAGIDVAKLGWFKVKGEQYELTEKGWWAVNAIIAHLLTVGLVSTAYMAVAGISGGEVEEEEDTPLLTRMLFPRIDRLDPTKRVSIPSYITEFYKIALHLGFLGSEAEYTKLVSGRVNSLVSNGLEAWYTGTDFRGVSIVDHDDNAVKQFTDKMLHTVGVLPISISTMRSSYKQKGFDLHASSLAFLGMTNAPAAAKRSDATNRAFELRRKEYAGKEVSEEDMEVKLELKRAMYAYQKGDKSDIMGMLKSGKISMRQYKIALTKIPLIRGQKNPLYKDQLSQALRGLTIEGAIEVWQEMSDGEQARHKHEILKKYMNMMARRDKPELKKVEVRKEMKRLGIIR